MSENREQGKAEEHVRHDHGPDCTCGCHDHDHEHGREHGGHSHDYHGHHHDHAGREETLELANARVAFEAHTHEQTATVSMTICPAEGDSLEFGDLVAVMQRIASAVEEAGGIVGHIKAYAKQGDAFAHASVTAADLAPALEGERGMKLDGSAVIQLAAIVLLVDQDALLDICKAAW